MRNDPRKQIGMMKTFIKRLLCGHLNWTDDLLFRPTTGEYRKTGYKDWRTDESYWECTECGKVKRFRYRHVPINYDLTK